MDRGCAVPGCFDPHHARGYCGKHYQRLRLHGDPVAGGFFHSDARAFLERLPSHIGDECLIWPFGKFTSGYGSITLNGRTFVVSRYLCEVVRGAPPTQDHEAAHSCGKGHLGCVNPNHLSWKTHAENMADAVAHGTSAKGERNGQAKITSSDVIDIRILCQSMTQRDVALRYGLSQSSIHAIVHGKKWSHIAEGLSV